VASSFAASCEMGQRGLPEVKGLKDSRKVQVRAGREPILQAAVDNFARRGYHGTSIRDIARDADVTVASIYNHFPSKQHLLQEIMRTVLIDTIDATRIAIARVASGPAAQLDALMQAWVTFHAERRAEALIGASEIRSLDDEGRRVVVALRDEQEWIFREIVERGLASGAFSISYPRDAVRVLIAMGTSVPSWYRPGEGLQPGEVAARYVALARSLMGAAGS